MRRVPTWLLAVACSASLQPLAQAAADATGVANAMRPAGSIRTATFVGMELPYEVVDGMAVQAGDMILGRIEDFESPSRQARPVNARHRAWPAPRDLSTVETQFLWLEGSIPYAIHDEVED